MMLSFLVANAYKGVLFFFLTTLSVPTVPNTLEEVVQSEKNYLIVTINGILIPNQTRTADYSQK